MIRSFNNNLIAFDNNVILGYPPSAPSTLKILVAGDFNASTVSTQLSNEIVSLGYNTPTMTTQNVGSSNNSYTGSDINTSTYDVVLYYTSPTYIGSTSLSGNLRNYVNNGGNLITATYLWGSHQDRDSNTDPLNFDFTLTPFNKGLGNNNPSFNGNMTITIPHPITNILNTAITDNNPVVRSNITSLSIDSTTIATYTTDNIPYVAIKTLGYSRIVGLNIFMGSNLMSLRPNARRLVTNSVLWATKILN